MISGDEDETSRYSWLSLVQALLLAAILIGTSVLLGGARLWGMLPIYEGIAGLILTQILRVILTKNSYVFRFDVADAFAAAFVCYAFIRYLTAPSEYYARLEFLNILSYATCFWVARYALIRSGHVLLVLHLMVFAGIGVAVFALWLKVNPLFLPFGENLHHYYAPRLTGCFGCPNHLGAFLVLCICAALGAALFIRGMWPLRIFYFWGAALMILVVGLTLSRGSWLGLLFAFLAITIFCMRHSSLKWIFPLGFFLISIGAALLVIWQIPIFSQRLDEVFFHFQHQTLDQYVRVQLAHDALHIWRDYLWWGSGPATFAYLHPRYQGPHYNTLAIYTHNDYLNLLADYGLVGGILALGFLIGVTVVLFRQVDHRARSVHRVVLCAALAGWSALLMHSILDFNLHIPACAIALFTLTGLGLRRSEPIGAHLPYERRQLINLGFASILILVGCGFGFLLFKTAAGYAPYWQVVNHSPKFRPYESSQVLPMEEALPLLLQSVQKDPQFPESQILLGDYYRTAAAEATWEDQRRTQGTQALVWYARAQKANPLDDSLLFKRGLVLDQIARYDEAYLCLEEATQRQPYNGFYWMALARHFQARKEKKLASAAAQRAAQCPYGYSEAAGLLLELEPPLPPIPASAYEHPPTIP